MFSVLSSFTAKPKTEPETEPEIDLRAKQKMLQLILELIAIDSSITTFELAEKCGKSRTTIQSYIRMLKNDKRIARVGANKGGKWRIL